MFLLSLWVQPTLKQGGSRLGLRSHYMLMRLFLSALRVSAMKGFILDFAVVFMLVLLDLAALQVFAVEAFSLGFAMAFNAGAAEPRGNAALRCGGFGLGLRSGRRAGRLGFAAL